MGEKSIPPQSAQAHWRRAPLTDQLRRLVMDTAAGELLSEAGLARQFDVRRSQVRAAVSEMVAEGFLRREPGHGTRVTGKVADYQTLAFCPSQSMRYACCLARAEAAVRSRHPGFILKNLDWQRPNAELNILLAYRSHEQADLLQPIDAVVDRYPDLDPDHYQPEAVNMFRHHGRLLALPLLYSAVVMHYNAEIFGRAGIPEPKPDWTWRDAIEISRALCEGVYAEYGMAIVTPAQLFLTMIRALGGAVTDQVGGPWNLRTDAVLEASQLFSDLSRFSTFDGEEQAACAFSQGRAAMLPWGGNLSTLTGAPLGPWVKRIPMPRLEKSATWIVSEGLGIGRECRNIDLASDMIHELAGHTGQRALAESGLLIPALQSLAPLREGAGLYASELPNGFVPYEVADRAVQFTVITQLKHLHSYPDYRAFCQHTEELVNGILKVHRSGLH